MQEILLPVIIPPEYTEKVCLGIFFTFKTKELEPEILFVDLFAGAGGVTTGVSRDPRVKVIVCINHDKNAILSHAANHPVETVINSFAA